MDWGMISLIISKTRKEPITNTTAPPIQEEERGGVTTVLHN
jgi:hypothetical protein